MKYRALREAVVDDRTGGELERVIAAVLLTGERDEYLLAAGRGA